MPQNFLDCDRDQPLLLLPDLRDWPIRFLRFLRVHLAVELRDQGPDLRIGG